MQSLQRYSERESQSVPLLWRKTMSTSRPEQTRASLMRPRSDQPCAKKCGRSRVPGRSYCDECRRELDRARPRKRVRIYRTAFLRDPALAIELAEKHGSVSIVNSDGTVHSVLSIPCDDRKECY